MADNGGGAGGGGSSAAGTASSSSSRPSARPTISLPPRSSMENLFMGGPGASPGPMTLVSSYFSDNDPGSELPSFSQLLAGAMESPVAFPALRMTFPPQQQRQQLTTTTTTVTAQPLGMESYMKNDKEAGGSRGGVTDMSFTFKQSRPTGLMISQPAVFAIPPGLSPATLLDSPALFSPGQAPFGMSHQQALAQVTAQAAQAHTQLHAQTESASTSAASVAPFSQLQSLASNMIMHQEMRPHVPDPNVVKEPSDISASDQRPQPSFPVDKPVDDGYNWRKYGQKHVKGSEYPRSYYKCTHPNCPVKKKVERSLDGQVTEIIYKGQHNHQKPQSNKRSKDAGNPNGMLALPGNSELLPEDSGNLNQPREGMSSYLSLAKDQECSQATQDHTSSDSEEVGDAEIAEAGRDNDEPESKRRALEIQSSEQASSHRTVTEPRIIVQTTSEVDLLDDGYRWRKYGQKVVKGNPYPRSYYKCTNPGCNVRKHVERAASDPKAVITTYEGKHSHDVPAARNSSHNTANISASMLRPHNIPVENQAIPRSTEYTNREQQPIALLRFKEEQIT